MAIKNQTGGYSYTIYSMLDAKINEEMLLLVCYIK